ncbi:MAG TPA: SET domain-containing protein [Isosphaeraceae bacterium]
MLQGLAQVRVQEPEDAEAGGPEQQGGGQLQGPDEPEAQREDEMPPQQSDAIEVKRIQGKGRGVFARRLIRKGAIIERVPVIVLPAEEVVGGTTLANYSFQWGRGQAALALGYGSLYNHSYRPNARYWDVGPQTKEFTALRDIVPGEEITVNYHGKPRSRSAVWFEVVETAVPAKAGPDEPRAAPPR